LPLAQDQISLKGHAIEARLYAEDPARNFLPSTGRLHVLRLAAGGGVRVDSGVEEGQEVSPYYDPMLAKIIAHAPTRKDAIDLLAGALRASAVAGPRTNLLFLRSLLASPAVLNGTIDTGLIERELAKLAKAPARDNAAAARAVEELLRRERARLVKRGARRSNERHSPWDNGDAFGFSGRGETEIAIRIDGEPAIANAQYGAEGLRVSVDGSAPQDCELIDAAGGLLAIRGESACLVELAGTLPFDPDQVAGDGVILAPMHGKVLAIEVGKGDRVTKGQRLAVIEAMKMEHALHAHGDGVVADVTVEAGAQVAEGARLLVIESDAEE
jgi:3-methylcrotonyl-CoA carboxylase alpha subunit